MCSQYSKLHACLSIFILTILFSAITIRGQAISSVVESTITYSQNEKLYLKTVPYDNEIPSLRGKTSVYEKGSATPLYVFDRGFDSIGDIGNKLILSNDGETIFYVIDWEANEEKEGLKSVTIYKRGKIFKSFTKSEITGCDEEKERCDLVYSNYNEVIDKEKSNWGTRNYRKVFKEGVSEKERFLSDFAVFSFDDTVYITDSKKITHLFDLKDGSYIGSKPFDSIFEQIKDKGRFNKTEVYRYDAPVFLDFPKLKNGKDTYESLAETIGMKSASIFKKKDDQYKLYRFKIDSVISQDGSLEIENIEFYDELPKEKIIEFFKSNKFDSSTIPKVFDKWYIRSGYFYFRNKSERLARQEKQQVEIKERQEYARRLTLETINNVYIPKNLEDCFLQLDKLLSEIDKKEMQALPKRDNMIQYHLGLGMWIRNNWGLWGGSRLQKYFNDRGITHPDEMSSIILEYYYDWLSGKRDTWKDWERNPKSR